jgi:hypothetical protein
VRIKTENKNQKELNLVKINTETDTIERSSEGRNVFGQNKALIEYADKIFLRRSSSTRGFT